MNQKFFPIDANRVVDLNKIESVEAYQTNKNLVVALYSTNNRGYIVQQNYQASVLKQLGYKIERDEVDGSPILSVITSDW